MNGTGGVLGFELLRPALLVALLAAPLALVVGLVALRARAAARARIVDPARETSLFAGMSRGRARARVLLACGGVLFLALGLVGPVRGFSWREVHRRGLDLVVCVDTSRSMLVQDLKPDRLGRARREVSALLDHLKGDRVALVAFSGDVRDVAPLTRDRQTLHWFLESLSPDDNVKGGTDLGMALAHALEMFDGRTGAHEAVVLLTDGEDLEGSGLALAQQAGERGIHVYVVGMGTAVGGKIPAPEGGFVRDESGQEVVSKLDDATLRAIAEVTGGAYLAASDAPLPLEEIYEKRIGLLEGRELVDGKERIPHDRYQWALVLGLVCMLLEAALRERLPARAAARRAAPVATEVVQ